MDSFGGPNIAYKNKKKLENRNEKDVKISPTILDFNLKNVRLD